MSLKAQTMRGIGWIEQWRTLGNPALLRKLTGVGEQRGLVTIGDRALRTIEEAEQGQLRYLVARRVLTVGPSTVTEQFAEFPQQITGGRGPERIGWLVADNPDWSTRQIVVAVTHLEGRRNPFSGIRATPSSNALVLEGKVWNPERGEYEEFNHQLGSRSPFQEPVDAVVSSALEFIRYVGEGNGIGTALWVANTDVRLENDLSEAAIAAIPTDLQAIGPAVGRAAKGPTRERYDPAVPVDRLLSPSTVSPKIAERVHEVTTAMATAFEGHPKPEWEGQEIDLPVLRRRLETEPDAVKRRDLVKLVAGNYLARHEAPTGLFSQRERLNEAVRADPVAGFRDYADYAARVYLDTTPEAIIDRAREVAEETREARSRFLAELRTANEGRPIGETDFEHLVGRMSQSVHFTLDEALSAVRRFYRDLGFNLEEGALSEITYDLQARPHKFGNTVTVPLSNSRSWINGSLDPEHLTLDDLGSLFHEHLHHVASLVGSPLVQGAYLLVFKASIGWIEGSANALMGLRFRRGWLRRYLDPEFRKFPQNTLERIAEGREAAHATQLLRSAGFALQELALYREDDVAGNTWARWSREVLGFEGPSSPATGLVWGLPQLATHPGRYAGYFYGEALSRPLVAGVARAVESNDEAALQAEGRKIRAVLEHGAWMVGDRSIRQVLDDFMGGE